jgi:dTDP-4-dehydrorhamnose reductase
MNILDAIFSRLGVFATDAELDTVITPAAWMEFNLAETDQELADAVDTIVAQFEAYLEGRIPKSTVEILGMESRSGSRRFS